jgi:hypothetical protein
MGVFVMRILPQKSGPAYCIGQFRIEKVKSRWRVVGPSDRTFATLGGAKAWCHHQSRFRLTPRL